MQQDLQILSVPIEANKTNNHQINNKNFKKMDSNIHLFS